MKYWVLQIAFMKLLTPTISVSVELSMLRFCFVELTIGNPCPKDKPPPEFPRISIWTENDASSPKEWNSFVLVQITILNILALSHNEILGPADSLHEVVNAHYFCICGTFHVEILFCGANDWESMSQR